MGPEATMAKLTLSWPSAKRRWLMSTETSRSLRPTRAISPRSSDAATRSAAADAWANASTSASSLMARKGAVTSDAGRQLDPGRQACSRKTKVAQARSLMASVGELPAHFSTNALTRPMGSSVSPHGQQRKDAGHDSYPGRLQFGHHQGRLAPARGGHDEHGQPFEGHGHVTRDQGSRPRAKAGGHRRHARPWPRAPAPGGQRSQPISRGPPDRPGGRWPGTPRRRRRPAPAARR